MEVQAKKERWWGVVKRWWGKERSEGIRNY